uniref:Uncharacterized protein n=1 Tax=Cacopsylla melanoneura TaxID=428564 RepID=A0A8D9AQ43_9HEMI
MYVCCRELFDSCSAGGHTLPLSIINSFKIVDLNGVSSQSVSHDVVFVTGFHNTFLVVPVDTSGPRRHQDLTLQQSGGADLCFGIFHFLNECGRWPRRKQTVVGRILIKRGLMSASNHSGCGERCSHAVDSFTSVSS